MTQKVHDWSHPCCIWTKARVRDSYPFNKAAGKLLSLSTRIGTWFDRKSLGNSRAAWATASF
jgi:hypothetical protein